MLLRVTVIALVGSLLVSCGRPEGGGSSSDSSVSQQSSAQAIKVETEDRAKKGDRPRFEPAVPLTNHRQIDDGDSLKFLYVALSGLPPDYEDLAKSISREYLVEQDGFRKKDIMTALRPQIDAKLAEAKKDSSRYVKMIIDASLDNYVFEGSYFPIAPFADSEEGLIYSWPVTGCCSQQSIVLKNVADFSRFVVDDEALARQIEQQISQFRGLYELELYAFIEGANLGRQQLEAVIRAVSGKTRDGTEISVGDK